MGSAAHLTTGPEEVVVTYVDVNGLPTWHEVHGDGPPVARRRPDLVDRLVLIGQYYSSSGKVPGGLTDELGAGGDQVMGVLRVEYQVSPDGPGHFPVVYAKTLRMLATEPELDLASLAAVAAPPWPPAGWGGENRIDCVSRFH